MSADAPELSVILPTDTYETIRPVLEHLRRQTIADRLEIVLVVPRAAKFEPRAEFGAMQIVQVESISPMGAARAAGLKAARAPFVFLGETHSYLRADAAEKLLATAIAGNWTAVMPGFENANPKGVFSWAGFLVDYGRWTPTLPAGETRDVPLYNALFCRDALMQASDQLERTLAHGDELLLALRACGARVCFEPSARILHLNLDSFTRAVHEQFLAGTMIGTQRAQRWSWLKRTAYVFGSPLIPFVLFRRDFAGAWQSIHAQRLSLLTVPAMFLLNVAKGFGEMLGYAGAATEAQRVMMDHYEIRKRDYVAK